MRHYRKAYFMIGLVFVVLGFMLKAFYRPFAISSGIQDLGFSNSAPSLFYVTGFSLLLSVHRGFKPTIVILAVVMASISYEIYQAPSFASTDLSDVIYSVAGGTIALAAHGFLQHKSSKNSIDPS